MNTLSDPTVWTSKKRVEMFKSSRKWAAVAGVATVSALALTACAAQTPSTGEGTPGASTDAGSGTPVTIEYWHRLPSVEGAKTVDDMVAEWNKENPNIQVKATALTGSAGESYPKISAAVEAGNAPCLAQIGVDRVPDLLSTGQLLDVTEQAAQYKDNYLEYAWGRTTFAGATYGLPQDTGPLVMYYRTDLFKEYGIDVPTTWDEYKEAAKTVREKNPDAYIQAFLPDEAMWMMALSQAAGSTFWNIESDAWKVAIDSPESQKVASYWQDLIDTDLVTNIPRWDPNFDKGLNEGTLVATIGASWEAPLIAGSAPETKGNWGVAQLPAWDAANPMVGEDGGSVVGVLKGCEFPAEALAFTDWLNTNTADLMPLGLFPATPAPADGFATPEGLKEFFGGQDIYAEFSTANNNVNVNWSFSPTTGVTLTGLQDGMGKLAQDGAPLPELFKAAQQASVDSLKAAGINVTE